MLLKIEIRTVDLQIYFLSLISFDYSISDFHILSSIVGGARVHTFLFPFLPDAINNNGTPIATFSCTQVPPAERILYIYNPAV
jgi:hypothetical protein